MPQGAPVPASAAPPARPAGRRILALLAPIAAVLVLVATSLLVSPKKFLWYDEIVTLNLLTDPSVGHMLRAMAAGAEAAPPLYHFLARGWALLFGAGTQSLRFFSAVGLAASSVFVWRLLRRAYEQLPAALGLLTIYCGSLIIAQQAAEIRFYGVLMATATLALWLAHRTMTRDEPGGTGALIATAAAHGALVLSHLFGFFYSGAILVALVLWDLSHGGLRVRSYVAIAIGWLAYLPWAPSTIRQAGMGKPHNWLPAPTLSELVQSYQFEIVLLPLVLAAVVLLAVPLAPRVLAPVVPNASTRSRSDAASRRGALLLLATGLLGVPILVFVISRVVTAVFLVRYLLPCTVAWAVLVAHLVDRLAAPADSARRAEAPGGRRARSLATAGMVGVCPALVLYALYGAARFHPTQRPGSAVEKLLADSLAGARPPVAVEDALQFLPAEYYARGGTMRYRFVLDWESAIDPRTALAATMQYKGMRLYQRIGYLAPDRVVPASAFLCGTDPFVALDNEEYGWVDRRIVDNALFESRTLGRIEDRHGAMTVRLVRRKVPCSPSEAAPSSAEPAE